MHSNFSPFRLAALSVALAVTAGGLHAKTFKWTSASDIPTWDIHSQNNALANGVHASVYESLVYYNSRTFKPEPMLASSWTQVSPTQLRMTLRSGVKFHDGSAFTADDAVFSIERAMSKTSTCRPLPSSLPGPRHDAAAGCRGLDRWLPRLTETFG